MIGLSKVDMQRRNKSDNRIGNQWNWT